MKIKSIAAAALASAILLTGCSGDIESTPQQSTSSSSKQPSGSGNIVDGENSYSNGATQLSMKNGSLSISRRSDKNSGSSRGNGWTILVYLCGTDLESENGAAAADIYEMMNANASDDVHIVFQTGGTNGWSLDISDSAIQRYALENGGISLVEEIGRAHV